MRSKFTVPHGAIALDNEYLIKFLISSTYFPNPNTESGLRNEEKI